MPFLSKPIIIKVDPPNKNIYQIDGYIEHSTQQIFFSFNHILLRGGRLKNVDYIYGIILYSGKDTKLMQNINNYSYKKSSIERSVNVIVLYVIGLTFIICIAGGLIGHFREIFLEVHGHFYLYSDELRKKRNYIAMGFKYFGTYFAIFNNIIPICLMIALEAVKGLQVIFTSFDTKLYDGLNDQLKILSFRLHEDLGNVQYIFSDKTGTLTKNEMKFKACSIYNKLYSSKGNNKGKARNKAETPSFFDDHFDKDAVIAAYEDNTQLNIQSADVPIYTVSDSVRFFFLNIVLNHGVLTEKSANSNKRAFQGTNPDELTLVQAANELGFEYLDRIGNIIRISLQGVPFEYEVLHRFEFSSERLRSSILVKERNSQTEDYLLFMKGADSVVLTEWCLDDFSLNLLFKTEKDHIDNFAKEGLRTLCYCMKVVEKDLFDIFNKEYLSLKEQALKSKALQRNVERLISDFERNMTLLGVTSLEDKLQDNVKADIQELIEAGIHVWMLTGDKMDTAETIAYSCRLFNNDTEVFKIKADNEVPLKELLADILKKMEQIEEKMKQKTQKDLEKKYSKITQELKFFPKKIRQEDFIKYLAEEFKLEQSKEGETKNNRIGEKEEEKVNNMLSMDIDKQNKEIQNIVRVKVRPTSSHIKKLVTNKRRENSDMKPNKNDELIMKERDKVVISDRDIIQFICNKDKDILNEENTDKDNQNANDSHNSINSVIKEIIDSNPNENENDKGIDNKDIDVHHISNQQNTKPVLFQSSFKPITPSEGKSTATNSNRPIKSTNTEVEKYRISICNKLNNIEEQKRQRNFGMRKSNKMDYIMSNHDSLKNFGLIIEGISITKCMEKEIEDVFMQIITKCRSVVCSRCSPIQKSDMVAFVKRNGSSGEGVTLAIGDGGNDVNMIKEADIGIGIFGKEGYQAAFNSDYAISQFKYLKRLLFYHGRYFLMRNSYFIYYFFYKSVIYTMIHFWFLFYNGFSSSFIYDDSMFLIYNAVGSNIPVAIRAVLEQDIDMDFEGYPKRNDIKKLIPDIYREYRERQPFSYMRFCIVFVLSLVHSLVIYYVPNASMSLTSITPQGFPADFWTYALIAYLNVIIIQTLVIIADSYLYKPFTFFAYFLHVFFNLITIIVNNFNAKDQCGGITFELAATWHFWLIMLLTVSIAYYPYLFYTRADLLFIYDIINGLRFGKYEYDIDKKVYLAKLEKINQLKRLIMKFKKFYADKDCKPDNSRDIQMKEMVEKYKSLQEQLREAERCTGIKGHKESKTITIQSNERLNGFEEEINHNEAVFYDYPEFLLKENKGNDKEEEEGNEEEVEYEYLNGGK